MLSKSIDRTLVLVFLFLLIVLTEAPHRSCIYIRSSCLQPKPGRGGVSVAPLDTNYFTEYHRPSHTSKCGIVSFTRDGEMMTQFNLDFLFIQSR